MPNHSEITELETIRHDLRNVLTALRLGCKLIGSNLDKVQHEREHSVLDEMHRSIEEGNSVVERLRSLEHTAG